MATLKRQTETVPNIADILRRAAEIAEEAVEHRDLAEWTGAGIMALHAAIMETQVDGYSLVDFMSACDHARQFAMANLTIRSAAEAAAEQAEQAMAGADGQVPIGAPPGAFIHSSGGVAIPITPGLVGASEIPPDLQG